MVNLHCTPQLPNYTLLRYTCFQGQSYFYTSVPGFEWWVVRSVRRCIGLFRWWRRKSIPSIQGVDDSALTLHYETLSVLPDDLGSIEVNGFCCKPCHLIFRKKSLNFWTNRILQYTRCAQYIVQFKMYYVCIFLYAKYWQESCLEDTLSL